MTGDLQHLNFNHILCSLNDDTKVGGEVYGNINL